MMTDRVIVGSGVSGVIVYGPAGGMLKMIVGGVVPKTVFALSIACRSEPAPLSLVLVTTNEGPTQRP